MFLLVLCETLYIFICCPILFLFRQCFCPSLYNNIVTYHPCLFCWIPKPILPCVDWEPSFLWFLILCCVGICCCWWWYYLFVLLLFLKFLKNSNQSSFKLSVNILTYFRVEAIFFVSLIEWSNSVTNGPEYHIFVKFSPHSPSSLASLIHFPASSGSAFTWYTFVFFSLVS